MNNTVAHWVAISGSWRHSAPGIIDDVKGTVADVIDRGAGIITGGALGVDQIATESVLALDPAADHLVVILPTSLDIYAGHYRQRAAEGVITTQQAESLVALLAEVRNRRAGALVELDAPVVDVESYFARNTAIVQAADELVAFQVDGSAGTQDAIDKAQGLGKPVDCRRYESS